MKDSGVTDRLISSPCPLCSCTKTEDIWLHETDVTNGICTRCGHVYLTRRYSEKIIGESYLGYRQRYPDEFLRDETNPISQLAEKRIGFLKRHIPASSVRSVLEIGCGYGHFLHLMCDVPIKVGVEPSHEQVSFARSVFGLKHIIEGMFDKSLHISGSRPASGFEAVCAFHVLEHIVNPVDFIERMRVQLRPGGYLFLALPNLFTLSSDLIELYFICRNWHVHSFSPVTLTQLLEMNGFRVLAIEEETPTAMLRSSFMIAAQRSESSKPLEYSAQTIKENRLAAERFHEALDRLLQNIRGAFAQWISQGKRSAIYGGGIHTQALLELASIDAASINLIIDDDPAKSGSSLSGIAVMPFDKALMRGLDVIVVSSLASEHIILERLSSGGLPDGMQVKGVYRDFAGGNSRS